MGGVELVFAFFRRLVVFGLGCWVVINALLHSDERVPQLIIGMVMVGVLPIENLSNWFARRRRNDDDPTR